MIFTSSDFQRRAYAWQLVSHFRRVFSRIFNKMNKTILLSHHFDFRKKLLYCPIIIFHSILSMKRLTSRIIPFLFDDFSNLYFIFKSVLDVSFSHSSVNRSLLSPLRVIGIWSSFCFWRRQSLYKESMIFKWSWNIRRRHERWRRFSFLLCSVLFFRFSKRALIKHAFNKLNIHSWLKDHVRHTSYFSLYSIWFSLHHELFHIIVYVQLILF